MDFPKKIILIPGNGGEGPQDLWFPYLKQELEKHSLQVVSVEFPDSWLARECYWIPFLLKDLKADENTILIGHSSGAIAAMRLAETHKIWGSALVGAYHTDLNHPFERVSGYFNRPWKWEAIKNNQQWILQFASTNDPWIPIEEARYVQDQLNSEYHEFNDQGHFNENKTTFPELLKTIYKKLNINDGISF